MTDSNREELQAFAQKMHNEGAAGFAAGLTPWDSWDDFEERVGSRLWQGTAEHVTEPEKPARNFADRIVTTITALAVATLVIGIAGVFLTQEPTLQTAGNNTQTPFRSPTITTKIQLPQEQTITFSDIQVSAIEASATPVIDSPVNNPASLAINTALGELPATDTLPAEINTAAVTATLDSETLSPEPNTDSQPALAALNELPATAAGIPASMSADYSPNSASSVPVMEAASEQAEQVPNTSTDATKNNTANLPALLTEASMLDVHTEIQQQAIEESNEPVIRINNGGIWSVNLASYLKHSTALEMQKQFLEKGVAADLVTADVQGKTYYRLRVTGIENRDMALTQGALIKERLGLKDIWVTTE